jgi:hypothetical protein
MNYDYYGPIGPDGKPADRIEEPCAKCKASGVVRRLVSTDMTNYHISDVPPSAATTAVQTEQITCPECEGYGYRTPPDGQTVDLIRKEKVIGQCEVPPRFIPHPLVSMRGGDFIPVLRNGRMVYQVHPSLCPGDLALLVGYRKLE